MVVLTMKNKNSIWISIENLILFLNDVDIENIFISKKISSGNKNYKCFIAYLDDYNIKPFCIILPKTSRYIKSYDGGTKRMTYWENIMIFRIKLAIVWYKNLIVKPPMIKHFWKPKWNLMVMNYRFSWWRKS